MAQVTNSPSMPVKTTIESCFCSRVPSYVASVTPDGARHGDGTVEASITVAIGVPAENSMAFWARVWVASLTG